MQFDLFSLVSQIECAPIWTPKHHPNFKYTPSPLFNTIRPVAHARNEGTMLGTFLSLNPISNPLLRPVHSTSYLSQLFASQNLYSITQDQVTTTPKELPNSSASYFYPFQSYSAARV